MLCTNFQGRRVATKWNAVQKDKLSAFIDVLLLAGAEKNWNVDVRQLFLDHKLNPIYKASFGINRFENIQRNLRFSAVATGRPGGACPPKSCLCPTPPPPPPRFDLLKILFLEHHTTTRQQQ